MSDETHDPFADFHASKSADLEQEHRDDPMRRYESGEHIWLGNAGVEEACELAGRDASEFFHLHRADDNEEMTFTYGELVALSADFYGSPDDLFARQSVVNIPLMRTNVDELRKVFKEEGQVIEAHRRGESVKYPDHSVRLLWNAKYYAELALENVAHFGWHNMKAYCKYHQRALKLAIEAEGNTVEDPVFRKAVYYNAFADHFLTDAFAAGHLRVPRKQIIDHFGHLKLAGALSKLLHDNDGHHGDNFHADGEPVDPHQGLRVTNSLGDDWRTRCDGQLFISPWEREGIRPKAIDDQPIEVRLPATAVRASVAELLEANTTKTMPAGTFAATMFVPFPFPDEPKLTEKFPADMHSAQKARFEKLVGSVKWYTRIPQLLGGPGLVAKDVRLLFEALPDLMEEFRQGVTDDLSADPTLTERLPEAYIEGMRKLS